MAVVSKAKLIALIEQAFANTVYPGDDNISNWGGEDSEEIAPAFRGKHWQDLTNVDFLRCYFNLGALTFFDEAAFRFYLPAFMLAGLNDTEIDVGLGFYLDPLETEVTKVQRLDSFTPDQNHAIKAYMQYSDALDN